MEKKNKTTVKANRNYKDTLFRMLFRDAQQLLQLYNAVNGTHYTNAEDLKIVTLENAVYMNMKNDLAFVMDFYLNLYEHQSSFNPNMPLRDLFYVAREYQNLMEDKSMYASTLVKIPAPRFVVFYNGVEEQRERMVLKLSDAYQQKLEEPELELKVLMLNINTGNNKELMEQCQLLKEYMLYVECVRKYAKQMKLDEAVKHAVDECVKKGILEEFLRKHRAEAIAVSIFEYDEEREKEKLRRAEYEAGEERGIAQGIAQGIEQGFKQGIEEGIRQGVEQGAEQGIKILIHTCKEFQLSREDTLSRVQKEFAISEDDARKHLVKYWGA